MALNLFKATYLGPETLSDSEVNNIPYPRAEVHAHVVKKCAQASCILGLGVVGPAISYARGGRSAGEAIECGLEISKKMACVLLPMAPVLTELTLRLKNANQDQIKERARQLRTNRGQTRADRFADVGVVIGAAHSAHFAGGVGNISSVSDLLPGAMIGLAVGTLTAAVVTNIFLRE